MIISLLHGIHQKIFQMVSFGREGPLLYIEQQVSPLVRTTFTSEIMATLSHKLVDS